MGELDGKVAIITGAGRKRSIGNATAHALADLGADIVFTGTGRDPSTFPPDEQAMGWRDIDSAADEIRDKGRRALSLVVDVTDAEQVDSMVRRTLDEFGRVDILVNNAAYQYGPDRVPLVELEPDTFQKVVDVKVRGTYLCSRAVAKVLIDQGEGGKIVTVASAAGKVAGATALAYNAANFAQIGMTQSMALDLGPHRINVNAVCPGTVDTARLDPLGRDEAWQKMAEDVPVRRLGTSTEVGGLIAYLCTEASSWIHGQSINIGGGTVMD
jgi:NAD(P)-dependent dehydrogenase (short-subunit alcohol dehydrogenase family)